MRDTLWGGAQALFERARRIDWTDLLLVLALGGLLFGILAAAREFTGEMRPTVDIDLSPMALPKYTFFSLFRGLCAYVISLTFTLLYGYWAAKDPIARRVLVPLLDVAQSVPVLGFMPGLLLALVAIFPHSNIGLELAAILMIFTGQVWNMTFSFYYSVRAVPTGQTEVAQLYGFTGWQRFRQLELPHSTMGLVWNSMMSMAGGWFFLTISESFVLENHDFRLPGIGSYMSVAVARGNVPAMIWAILAMTVLIVILDQLLWRPLVVWAQKYRTDDSSQSDVPTSWFLQWLRESRALSWLSHRTQLLRSGAQLQAPQFRARPVSNQVRASRLLAFVSLAGLSAVLGLLVWGGFRLVALFVHIPAVEWKNIGLAALATTGRVLTATCLGTLWALPAGIAIGLSPKLSRILQPVVQVVASFPAPMLFPAVIALILGLHITLGAGSILLMLLGTQWYILFNVIAGAMVIPSELREAGRSYGFSRWQRFAKIYVPSVFPSLLTGWVTATGGAWNASIVAEYVSYHGQIHTTRGVGSLISKAASDGNFPLLAAAVLSMVVIVIVFNRTVWQRLYTKVAPLYSQTV